MTDPIHCLIIDDEPVAREILENHLSRIDDIIVVGSCKNAIDAFKIINDKPVDLLFLDINMPKLSGISFLKNLNCS